jgi:hypothetical protein
VRFQQSAYRKSAGRLGNLAAAKSSDLIHLLSEDEINSTGDAEVAVIKSEALKDRAQEAPPNALRSSSASRPPFCPVPSTFLTSRRHSLTSTSAFFSRSASVAQRLLPTSN